MMRHDASLSILIALFRQFSKLSERRLIRGLCVQCGMEVKVSALSRFHPVHLGDFLLHIPATFRYLDLYL